LPAHRARLERIETKLQFQLWLQTERLFVGWSPEQLLAYADRCEIPDPLPSKVPSKFDGLSRKALVRLREDIERQQARMTFRGRTVDERLFYVEHGHFPDEVDPSPAREQNQDASELAAPGERR